jgi:hypothetical protein
LTQPNSSLARPIESNGQQQAALHLWAVGRVAVGRQSERQRLSAAQSAGRLWAARCDRKIVFLCFCFTVYSFIFFVQFFEQISYSFLYSNYSNKKFV